MQQVKDFLILNGFEENEPNYFISDKCSVEIRDYTYVVCNGVDWEAYSPTMEIYWLIGFLTYHGYINKDYKESLNLCK